MAIVCLYMVETTESSKHNWMHLQMYPYILCIDLRYYYCISASYACLLFHAQHMANKTVDACTAYYEV